MESKNIIRQALYARLNELFAELDKLNQEERGIKKKKHMKEVI